MLRGPAAQDKWTNSSTFKLPRNIGTFDAYENWRSKIFKLTESESELKISKLITFSLYNIHILEEKLSAILEPTAWIFRF